MEHNTTAEALVVVPGAQLHQVEGGVQRLLGVGDLTISLVGEGDAQVVRAQVGSNGWNLGKHLPALKAAPTIYSFGLEHTRAIYYCLVLPPDTAAPALDAVEDVLASSCAYSTARQVDAAYEEADKLAGGKEAREVERISAAQPPQPGAAAAAAHPGGESAQAAGPEPGSAAATGYAGTPAAAPTPAEEVPPTAQPAAELAAAAAGPYPAPLASPPAAPSAAGPVTSPYPAPLVTPPSSATTDAPAAGPLPMLPAAPPAPRPSGPQDTAPAPTPGAVPPAAVPAVAAAAAAPAAAKPGSADRVANGLLYGGGVAADLVKKGSGALSDAIVAFKDKQAARVPAPDAQPAQVSPHFKRGLKVVATVACGAAYVTGRLAALVGDASYALALKIAKALPGHSERRPGVVAGSGEGAELAPEERTAFKTVGAAGLMAYVQVYDALEDAAKQVLSHSAEASAEYIRFKYGEEAGKAAQDSVPVAQDMLSAAINCTRLGACAMVSKTAKRAAKIYLKSTVAGQHPDEQASTRSRLGAASGTALASGQRPQAPPTA